MKIWDRLGIRLFFWALLYSVLLGISLSRVLPYTALIALILIAAPIMSLTIEYFTAKGQDHPIRWVWDRFQGKR